MNWLKALFGVRDSAADAIEAPPAAEAGNALQFAVEAEIIKTSPLFDVAFYARQVVLGPGEDPRVHYCAYGWRQGLDPSPYFSTRHYVEQNNDVVAAGHNPLVHYIISGWREGRRPVPGFERNSAMAKAPEFNYDLIDPYLVSLARRWANNVSSFAMPAAQARAKVDPATARMIENLRLSHHPLVSVIVPSRDGARHLATLFDSLAAQTYRNFEVILVDDGSSDDSRAIAAAYPFVTVVEGAAPGAPSVGFAAANNRGLRAAQGELIALQNNDTRLDPAWLEVLVNTMRADPFVGAVAPKIRFWTRFQRLQLVSAEAFALDAARLVAQLSYAKYFVRFGDARRGILTPARDGDLFRLVIDLPQQEGDLGLPFAGPAPADLEALVGLDASDLAPVAIAKGRDGVSVRFDDSRFAFHIINNAGSMDFGIREPGDRGLGEVDQGQYGPAGDVNYLCGCSALIRRDALDGGDLFIEDLVAYYEDSALSHRLRSRGFAIRYVDSAIVYHKHSASNVEFSAFWRIQTFRNRHLFKYIASPAAERAKLRESFETDLESKVQDDLARADDLTVAEAGFLAARAEIRSSALDIMGRVDRGFYQRRPRPRIGVFNAFWTTMGGGEGHALDMARAFARFGRVELISTRDFNLERLCRYFDAPRDLFVKRLVGELLPETTGEYDIFVNASYQSEVPSRASKSFYVVSFPSQVGITADFLGSYVFLANSDFTQSWMRRYWGEGRFRSCVVNPCVADAFFRPEGAGAKEKIILSVGRFANSGHMKNQLEIAQAFRRLVEIEPAASGWKLLLIGSVNAADYFAKVREACDGLPAEVVGDADFERVRAAYAAAAVYVHASGLGVDAQAHPELVEHFGIAVTQAVASGSIPVVYDAGGPSGILATVGAGYRFTSVDGLVERLREVVRLGEAERTELSRTLARNGRIFRRSALEEKIVALVHEEAERP